MNSRGRLLIWTAALVLGLRALHALGAGPLGVPLTSRGELVGWVDRTQPEVMAVALVRLAALACGWYLAVCTLALALTRPLGRPRLAAAVARMTPAVVGRIVSGGGGLGLAAGTLLGALPSTTLTTTLATSAIVATPAAATPADRTQSPGPPTPTATMTRMPDDKPGAPASATMTRRPSPVAASSTPPPAAQAPATPAVPPPPAAGPSSWIVEPGDSFWSIATDTVSPPEPGGPDHRLVAGYWRRLVEANRSRLIDPGNPDLLVPGQELVLPD